MDTTYAIFDLDGTVIDSSHRHLSKPDGSVDLTHWFENATPEKIAADSVLPLARSMRELFRNPNVVVVICTARMMQDADWQFLRDNDLPFHVALYRSPGDMRPDAEMKVDLLTQYLQGFGYASIREANCIMFEDNLKVIDAMMKEDVICYNAIRANKKMRAA